MLLYASLTTPLYMLRLLLKLGSQISSQAPENMFPKLAMPPFSHTVLKFTRSRPLMIILALLASLTHVTALVHAPRPRSVSKLSCSPITLHYQHHRLIALSRLLRLPFLSNPSYIYCSDILHSHRSSGSCVSGFPGSTRCLSSLGSPR